MNENHARAWIGVDLDGTLVHYTDWKGERHIGEAIPEMLARVKRWLEQGHRVKIVTARWTHEDERPTLMEAWAQWCAKYDLPLLEITNAKDYQMIELWDDRCVAVETNTGKPLNASRRGLT